MSRARTIYGIGLWKPRALSRARSLTGRPRTAVEQKVASEAKDHWDYFRVFGVQVETQAYVDKTIQMLEVLDPEDLGTYLTIWVRLGMSCEEIYRRNK